ncbi:MAG TPA: lysophospholipid acyltransferase family protein [Spirochaetia bacterium]|nr:lysophospholipid acyltransferase family protein [Spirochaetia bacterium]
MSEARPAEWADVIFERYLTRLMKRSFNAVNLFGEEPAVSPDRPLVLIGNHNTWWDGFFPYILNKKLFKRKFFIMMLEEQLARFPFFRRLGAYGIRQGHPHSVIETLTYSARLLGDAATLLCMFPQGELVPFHARPLGFKKGLERILRIHGGPVTLLQLAMRCEFLGTRLPEVFFLFGPPLEVSAETAPSLQQMERTQEELMQRVESMIACGARGRMLLGEARAGTA